MDELLCLYDMDFRNPDSYFVDDETGNCKGAEAVGMTAVHCVDASAQQVVRQLLSL